MVAYLYRIDTGFEGNLSRQSANGDVFSEILSPDADWSKYGFGRPVKYDDKGRIVPLAEKDTADVIQGFLVRNFPSRAIADDGFGGYPQVNGGAVPVARRGYMTVRLYGAAMAKKGAAVFIRIGSPSDTSPLGGVEAADSGDGNTIKLPNAQFEGNAGVDGITEISFGIK